MTGLTTLACRPTRQTHLESPHYERVFRVLEDCDLAESFEQFRSSLTQSLANVFKLKSTTFFVGATATLACVDPDPMLNGHTKPLYPVYKEHWHHYDVFQAPESIASLHRTRVASTSELRIPKGIHRQYVEDYLLPHQVHTSAALYLDLAEGQHALVGLFDPAEGRLSEADLATLRLLARQLNHISRQFTRRSSSTTDNVLSSLPTRAREVARLIGEGLSNSEIARIMVIQEDSVKKYVSRVLQRTGCQNRTELALRVRAINS